MGESSLWRRVKLCKRYWKFPRSYGGLYHIERIEIAEEGTSLLNEPFGSGKSSLSAGFEVG